MDAQRRVAELEAAHAAEVARSQRLEQQIGQLLEQLTVLTQRMAELTVEHYHHVKRLCRAAGV